MWLIEMPSRQPKSRAARLTGQSACQTTRHSAGRIWYRILRFSVLRHFQDGQFLSQRWSEPVLSPGTKLISFDAIADPKACAFQPPDSLELVDLDRHAKKTKFPRFGSLRARVLGAMLLVSVGPLMFTGIQGYAYARRAMVERTQQHLVSVIRARQSMFGEEVRYRSARDAPDCASIN